MQIAVDRHNQSNQQTREGLAAATVRVAFTCLGLCVMCLAVGCGSKGTEEEVDLELPDAVQDLTAQQYLQSIFTRYRDAESYRDTGRVKFSYLSNGRSQTTHAPLSVWFDRGLLYVQAYDVRMRNDGKSFRAWIADPTTSDYDSQVVRLPAQSGRPVINQLFADEVVNERIAAGLAGPPPQLEWLFASEPMKGLFSGEHTIEYDKSRELAGRRCVTINVVAGSEVYRFWIDSRVGVILRVDLPPVLVPIQLMPSSPEADRSVRLTLELAGATFQTPEKQVSMTELPSRPKFVRRFIPIPPEKPRSILGSRARRFSVRDQSGTIQLTQNGADRDITVIMFSQHADASNSSKPGLDPGAAFGLANWANMMTAEFQQQVRVVVVTDEPGFRSLPRDFPLPIVIDSEHAVESALRVTAGETAILNREGQIAWIQPDLTTDSLSRLGRIIADLIEGIDVPERLRQQFQADKATYETMLAAEMAASESP